MDFINEMETIMENKKPVRREKNVTAGSGSVKKTGAGLGTGPVGNVSSHSNSSQSGSNNHQQLNGGGRKSVGTRAGGMGIGGVAVIILFMLFKSFLGGSVDLSGISTSQTGGTELTGTQTSYTSNANSQQADYSVDASAREKRTVIDGTNDKNTIMVYMCGTDLESKSGMATNDLNEMLSASFSDNINLIVYTGGCKGWKNSVISSDRNQIYQIKDGKFICLEDNMGKNTMVDPATLTEFIKYCKTNFPANRNDLIFWDHGGGSITGYGYDEKYASAGSMTLEGIDKALSDAGMYFDFIGFDACLMATVENGLMLEQYADYMIASEETEPGVGWYYTNWLTSLSNNPSMPTVEIGKNIVDDFIDVCAQKCRGQKTTLSVVDLAELKATVPDELTDFAKSTSDLIKNNEYKKVATARNNTREFAQSSKIDQIDLVHLCENLGTQESKDLSEVIKGAVKYNRAGSTMSDANGLAIYFPLQNKNKISSALKIFNKIGMNSEYSKCIQNFASTQVAGQAAAGGTSNAYSVLSGATVGGGSTQSSSNGNSDAIMSLLNGMLSSGGSSSAESYGFDATSLLGLFTGREISDEDTVNYVASNYFDANQLVWNAGEIEISEEQLELVQNIELNVFVDDGEGYIDLGMDNVYAIRENNGMNYLSPGDDCDTWLAIDGNIVPYYFLDAVEYSNGYVITGYVPCLLNGERVELLLEFTDEDPNGHITGARYIYADNETEAVAKNLTEVNAGDEIIPICDYYSYEGEYLDSYKLDNKIVLSANPQISNIKVEEPVRVTMRLTDIYNQYYWTPVHPDFQ